MKKLAYPEFVVPASLAILIGLAIGAANCVLADHDLESWGIVIYLVGTGVALFRKSPAGTWMLAIGLIALLVFRSAEVLSEPFDWSGLTISGAVKTVLGAICFGSMVVSVIEQVTYFRSRSSSMASRSRTDRSTSLS